MLKKLILSASALAISACAYPTTTLAHEHESHEHEAHAHEAAESTASGPALWRVADEDTTIYLFGTVHLLPEGLDWLSPTVEQALTSSDQFVSEIDTSLIPEYDPASGTPPPPELMAILQMQMGLAQLTTGGTLRDLMNEEDRAEYETAMTDLGLPVAAFDGFEPWFAIIAMSQVAMTQAGLDASNGVERQLDHLIEGKDRAAFETVEQQMGFFDGLPMESQLTMLDESVEGFAVMREMFDQMVGEWVEGDPDGLAAIINDAMAADPILYDTLLTQRNTNWAGWIDDRLDQPGTVFIAVGAGHLAGQDSVQDFLTERGITAERIEY
ncbi:TraB/GumN family protein [Erythrobacter alti]|uniref:TraB/GumN family protein n=1 Tax=Erythrobacter alti TaxID=1896145 RepID=UPI0030F3E142